MADKEAQFDAAMLNIYRRAKAEAKYNATLFFQMLTERGGVSTAKHLINSPTPSEGYTRLFERGCLHLTVEATVVENPHWHDLFEAAEIDKARSRLMQYRYTPQQL